MQHEVAPVSTYLKGGFLCDHVFQKDPKYLIEAIKRKKRS